METTWVPEEIGLGGLMKIRRQAEFVPAKAHAKLRSGEVIRMLRELKGWTQAELAKRSGISATNISLLENEKVEIGKKRVEQLAKAFDIHPAITKESIIEKTHLTDSHPPPNLPLEGGGN